MKYYSDIKEWNFSIYDSMDGLVGILLRKLIQTEKDKYCMISELKKKIKQTNKYSKKGADSQRQSTN